MTGSVLSPAKQALLRERLARREPAAGIGRRPGDEPLVLSFAQERLWFMEQYAPGTAAYVVPVALRLEGPLDERAVAVALGAIVARHESLRLRVAATDDGRPHPHIAPPAPVDLAVVSVPDGLGAAGRDRRTREIVAADCARPFDLAAGPLLRATLIRRIAADHVLLVSVHHIAADGWSTDLIIGELVAAYDAVVTGGAPDAAEPPVRYGDFAAWQRARLTPAACAADVAYWRDQLAGLEPLELPADRLRPARQEYRGSGHGFHIDAELTAAAGRLAAGLGATPYMVLLAAFQALLWRQSGQTTFAVGSPVAGRTHPQTEHLVGMFANVLTLRADLRGDPSFAQLVGRVRDTALDAYAHQDVPFEHLVTELQVPRDTSRSPLFQVALAMQNYTRATRTLHGGVGISWFVVDAVATRFDLELYLYEHDEGLAGFFTYDAALFEPATVERLARHLLTLLRGALAEPHRPLADLPLAHEETVSRGERVAVPDTTLLELLDRALLSAPDAIAVVDDGMEYTLRQLHLRANRLAHHLVARGAGPGTRVAVCAPRGIGLVTALLAVVKAGGAYVPLDPDYPAARLDFMREDCAAVLVLGPDDETDRPDGPDDPPAVAVRPADPAYVIYTSGSTGRPKGAVNSHRAIVNRLLWMQRAFGLDATDAVLHKTPIGFDVSVWELFWPLITGARLVLARPGGHRDPAYLGRLIAEAGVTTVHFVPSMLAVFLAQNAECTGLRRVIASGEALPADLARAALERLGCPVHNLYGPTEAAIDVSWWECTPEALAGRARVPIGRPIQNVDLLVLDDRGRPQPVGVPGELCIAGAGLGDGYLHRPGLTARQFLPNPHGPAGSRLYRTGDRAALRADGALEYLGRLDDQVKLRGVRIELGEIESVLRELPGVADAAAAIREDVPGDQRLVGYVVPAPGAAVDPDEVRRRLRDTLPEQLVPAALVLLPAVPLSPNGKVDRRALPAPPLTRAAGGLPARTPAEELVAAAFGAVLGAGGVGRDDDFFALGGHSLLAVQVVARLRHPLAEAGLGAISVMDLFRLRTVRGLAEHAERGAAGPQPVRLLHELSRTVAATPVATLVCVPYGGGSAVVYQPLAVALGPSYRLFSLALPGHDLGTEEQARPMADVVPDVVAEILDMVPGPIIVYGHCGVGSAYAMAIALGLQAAGRPPEAVYIGAMFPFARPRGRLLGRLARLADRERILSDRVYASWLVGMGVDLSGLDQRELTVVIRAMRRDGVEAEDFFTGLFAGPPPRLDCPVISIVGDRDPATDLYRERYKEWLAFTDRAAVVSLDEGGHYFINHRAAEVAEIIAANISKDVSADALPASTGHPRGASDVPGVSADATPASISDARGADGVPADAPTAATGHGRGTAGVPADAPTAATGHARGTAGVATDATPAATWHVRGVSGPRPEAPAVAPSLRRFGAVAAGQLVSIMGSALIEFAVPLWLYTRTGSLGTFAVLATLGLLPGLLVLPLAGAIVDRADRRRIMLLSDCAAGVTQAAMIALLLLGHLDTAAIYVMITLLSVALTFQRLSFASAVPQLVPKRYLGHANGLVQTSSGLATLVVPVVAVAALSWFGIGGILVLDVVSYAVSVAVVLGVRFPATLAHSRRESLTTEILFGFRYSLGRPGLRTMLLYFAGLNVFLSPLLLMLSPLALSVSGLTSAGHIAVAAGAGALAGGLAVAVWGGPRTDRMRGLLLCAVALGSSGVLIGLRPSLVLIGAGAFGLLFALAVVNGVYATIVQTKVPQRYHGRVFALNTLIAWSTIPLGFAVIAPLATSLGERLMAVDGAFADTSGALLGTGPGRGIGLVYVLFGLCIAAWSAAALRHRHLARFDSTTPDAEPDDLVGLAELERGH
ncbi:amino acid adenylation domain-containing protein [Dactylosporangium sp. NPDC049140]|uniref:non-ribosomal peptide synthetase/MFS transporter n=1 Tax=Dactylosporangium sp. NPDC049140 TaxID=3155647 RepID=UPI0033DB6906